MLRETKRIAANDKEALRIGYYKGYHGNELSEAISLFSEKNPTIDIQITVESHEELYHAMENGQVDLALNDQLGRRQSLMGMLKILRIFYSLIFRYNIKNLFHTL